MAQTQVVVYHLENFTTGVSTADNMITAAQQGSDSFTVTTATGQVVATAVSLIPAATPPCYFSKRCSFLYVRF